MTPVKNQNTSPSSQTPIPQISESTSQRVEESLQIIASIPNKSLIEMEVLSVRDILFSILSIFCNLNMVTLEGKWIRGLIEMRLALVCKLFRTGVFSNAFVLVKIENLKQLFYIEKPKCISVNEFENINQSIPNEVQLTFKECSQARFVIEQGCNIKLELKSHDNLKILMRCIEEENACIKNIEVITIHLSAKVKRYCGVYDCLELTLVQDLLDSIAANQDLFSSLTILVIRDYIKHEDYKPNGLGSELRMPKFAHLKHLKLLEMGNMIVTDLTLDAFPELESFEHYSSPSDFFPDLYRVYSLFANKVDLRKSFFVEFEDGKVFDFLSVFDNVNWPNLSNNEKDIFKNISEITFGNMIFDSCVKYIAEYARKVLDNIFIHQHLFSSLKTLTFSVVHAPPYEPFEIPAFSHIENLTFLDIDSVKIKGNLPALKSLSFEEARNSPDIVLLKGRMDFIESVRVVCTDNAISNLLSFSNWAMDASQKNRLSNIKHISFTKNLLVAIQEVLNRIFEDNALFSSLKSLSFEDDLLSGKLYIPNFSYLENLEFKNIGKVELELGELIALKSLTYADVENDSTKEMLSKRKNSLAK